MGSAAHVFVDDLTSPVLSDEDHRHLERVLRLRPGEEVTAADGRGGWRRFRYEGAGRLDPLAEVERRNPPEPPITVGFALTKGERPEWTVQKLTEAGVDRIMPFVTARSIVRLDGEKGTRRLARLRAVARAAAMQSRQARVPDVGHVTLFPEAVTLAGPGAALAHPGGNSPGLDRPAVLIGPEGGFTDDELDCGLPTVSLGPPILRAETAAMAAGVLLCALRANVVGPAR
jgi:16S rRNA (uracil1498-N3)-methyltransferase